MERARLAAPPFLLALVIMSCAPRTSVPVDPAAFFGTAVDPWTAQVHSLRSWLASGRLQCRLEGREGRGRLRVIHVAPHRLRADIEISGFFGLFGARSVLWAGEEGLVWQEGSGRPQRVDADSLFAPVLGPGAGVPELELLLFGLPVLWERWPEGGAAIRREGKDYILTALLPDGSREWAWVGGSPLVLRRLERRDSRGEVKMAARFDRHRLVGGLLVAGRLEIRAPDRGNRLKIDWGRLEPDWPQATEALGWPEE